MADEEYSDHGPKCPNPDCGRQITADEGHYYDESNYEEETCHGCGETFDVEVSVCTTWTTRRREVST